MTLREQPIAIIGAGPAGLTAAYQLAKAGLHPVVVEADDIVGGLSRTVVRDGWRFDIGGHRFHTEIKAVDDLWHEILPDEDFLLRRRLSRIYYRGRYFDYPLRIGNALRNLGPLEAALCVASYAKARLRPPRDQDTYEDWLVARFGERLFRTFFKSYTEKVWGMSTAEMPSDWAAERVKTLDLGAALLQALGARARHGTPVSLIEEFHYPRLGPGMMWERCRDLVECNGGAVHLSTRVTELRLDGGTVRQLTLRREGAPDQRLDVASVISSMPLGQLVTSVTPGPPATVVEAAKSLRHRAFLTVALVVPEDKGFPDNWIYIHSPEVRVGRIQNYRSWSADLVKTGWTALGLEYFLSETDPFWGLPDRSLVDHAAQDLARLGLLTPAHVADGYVERARHAYPIYDLRYRTQVASIHAYLLEQAANLYTVGRSGQHRYNNQDDSMHSAMCAVSEILRHDRGEHPVGR